MAHLLLTFLHTQLIMYEMNQAHSQWDDWIEFLVITLFLLDEIPDIVLEGIKESTTEFHQMISDGFLNYIKISG